ncbi:MAG TPA: hypothetical protein VIH71_07575 [Solirubrobacteraceae bacterium]
MPVTAEHVWPQWIAKYVPQTEIKAEHYVLTETEGEAQTTEFRGERVPFTTEARCVCKPCNEGWMAEMEHTAEHELHAMIEGRSQTLHEWRQTIAATWAFKTAIMVEQAHATDRAIPSEFYPLFWRYLTPPPYSQVWLGMYAGGESPHFYGRGQLRFLLTTPEGVSVPNDLTAYGAVLQVGALVFRLFGHLVKDGPVSVPTGEIARSLIQIRPTVPAPSGPRSWRRTTTGCISLASRWAIFRLRRASHQACQRSRQAGISVRPCSIATR